MIKKFFSNALLSVVMDKSARRKLADMRGDGSAVEAKPSKSSSESRKRNREDTFVSGDRPGGDAAATAEDLAQTIEMALADARAEAQEPQERQSRPAKKASPFDHPAKPMTPAREKLIREAISIHQQKSKVLDELDPAVREKLTVMAMMALDPDSLPDDVKPTNERKPGRPVDEIGGARKKPPKRR